MAPRSALPLLRALAPYLDLRLEIATLAGRAIAMDRAENWDRTIEAYHCLTENIADESSSPEAHIEEQYRAGIGDEFMAPARFTNVGVEPHDALLFFNFRADRMRQLVKLFTKKSPHTVQSRIRVPPDLFLASMTNYDNSFGEVRVLFPKKPVKNNLGEWVSASGLRQLRLAETEKYAHVTYFLNGGREIKYAGEERLLIPSLGLKNYAEKPIMSLPEVTNVLLSALQRRHFNFIAVNIANGDMVGHSGDLPAAIEAAKHVDTALAKIIPAAEAHEYAVGITADHGNIEYIELTLHNRTYN
ncbi:MAG: alkaline phosphatase family protein [Candidatus Magasanikbacteria bacterium]|nr:alkaline phosphatase family protein [Candidatus Magasanikbacteria bacterium]